MINVAVAYFAFLAYVNVGMIQFGMLHWDIAVKFIFKNQINKFT